MVLQYVPEIATFAAECRRVLAPGGQLLVLVDHPFHAQFLYAQQLAGTPQPKYQGLGPYFEARVVRKLSLWGKVELTWYPRTVAQYVQAFLDVGLGLAHLRELPSDLDGVTIPRILALHFRKPA
jgi:ubiquinone/menaquinone biosynthesis C-methylase UbiE